MLSKHTESLNKLYYLTKGLEEKLLTTVNHPLTLMDFQNAWQEMASEYGLQSDATLCTPYKLRASYFKNVLSRNIRPRYMKGFMQAFFFERHNLAAIAMSSKTTPTQFTKHNIAMSFVNANVPNTRSLPQRTKIKHMIENESMSPFLSQLIKSYTLTSTPGLVLSFYFRLDNASFFAYIYWEQLYVYRYLAKQDTLDRMCSLQGLPLPIHQSIHQENQKFDALKSFQLHI